MMNNELQLYYFFLCKADSRYARTVTQRLSKNRNMARTVEKIIAPASTTEHNAYSQPDSPVLFNLLDHTQR
jgi:hypothetical protein